MIFSIIAHFEKRESADVLLIPFWQGGTRPGTHSGTRPGTQPRAAAFLHRHFEKAKVPISCGDFQGKEGELLLVYDEEEKEKRALLVGLGSEEKLSVDLLRRCFAQGAKFCQKKRLKCLNVILPTIHELRQVTAEECVKGICEGLLLANYNWSQKQEESEGRELLEKVSLIGILPKLLPLVQECKHIAEGVYLARDLINGNADLVTPQYLVEAARKVSKKFPQIKTTVFDKEEIVKKKMGLLLAVSSGSPHDPAFILMEYKGAGKSKDHTVLLGKGVTFDTGGLNLKPTGSMETMRDDMAGAAAVIATLAVCAALKLKVNVTGVIPSAENAIDGKSFKPGDVYQSFAGKTVEIANTDAEGRLLLADALSYATRHLHPTRMINFATLTGAIVIALGDSVSGIMSNDDDLAADLIEAGLATNELLWRLPLHAPYKELLKSDIADLKNVGGRPAGAILAALFLQEFVEKKSWAHIDIAGTAFSSKEHSYLPKNGVGVGVRLAVEFLKKHSK